jgi:hypothetical protein
VTSPCAVVVLVALLVFARPAPTPRPVELVGDQRCIPGQVLDLKLWKLQLPIGQSEKPTEVKDLVNAAPSQYFTSTPECEGVVFRAPVNGVTTSGSKNPRSELREMGGGGDGKAGWSSGSGTHWMAITQAFTKLPEGKPELVGGQIHDANDDVSVFRLEGTKLWITNGDNPHGQLVTDDYQLGTVFQAAFLVKDNTVGAYYNGRLVAEIPISFSGGYFKAGAYTQANCSNAPCKSENYGEVVIYDLEFGHS